MNGIKVVWSLNCAGFVPLGTGLWDRISPVAKSLLFYTIDIYYCFDYPTPIKAVIEQHGIFDQ